MSQKDDPIEKSKTSFDGHPFSSSLLRFAGGYRAARHTALRKGTQTERDANHRTNRR